MLSILKHITAYITSLKGSAKKLKKLTITVNPNAQNNQTDYVK